MRTMKSVPSISLIWYWADTDRFSTTKMVKLQIFKAYRLIENIPLTKSTHVFKLQWVPLHRFRSATNISAMLSRVVVSSTKV